MEEEPKPLRIFLCFDDSDFQIIKKIEDHCASLIHTKKIEVWHHRKIGLGQLAEQETKRQLENSDIILLMISSSLLNSERFFEVEKISLERLENKKSIVIPVLLKYAYLHGFNFTQLQMLPSDGEPIIKEHSNLDQRCKMVAEEIHSLVETLDEIKYSSVSNKEKLNIPFKENNETTPILYIINDPKNANPNLVNKEISSIKQRLLLGKCSCSYELIPKNINNLEELQKALLETRPKIIHFSGYSTDKEKIIFYDLEGKAISLAPNAVCSLFEIFSDTVRLVFLNACFSEVQARSISKAIEFVIGVKGEIDREIGLDFVNGFYQAISYGTSFKKAYRLGRNLLQLKNLAVFDEIKMFAAEEVNE